jgi:hypothetical protein
MKTVAGLSKPPQEGREVLDCGSALPLFRGSTAKSARALAQSKTLARAKNRL